MPILQSLFVRGERLKRAHLVESASQLEVGKHVLAAPRSSLFHFEQREKGSGMKKEGPKLNMSNFFLFLYFAILLLLFVFIMSGGRNSSAVERK
mmetsp:Transcript_36486/g.94784  ORF Transcript_36486/g.94784 Transcript_36486/m.94784 type:complete len:94 (-) Transcript_36486:47-328(-)